MVLKKNIKWDPFVFPLASINENIHSAEKLEEGTI